MFNLYSGDYKRYLILPALLFAVFLFLVFISPQVPQGLDLKGGTSITVRGDSPFDASAIEPALEEKYSLSGLQVSSVSSPSSYGLYLQFSENTDISSADSLLAQAKEALESGDSSNAKSLAMESISYSQKFVPVENASQSTPAQAVALAEEALVSAEEEFQTGLQETIKETYSLGDEMRFQKKEIGPSLGQSFYETGVMVSIIGFVLVVIVIFIFFREFIPSIAIVLAIVFDIAGALALMALFNIPLSLSTIPALLMLIGYSVDTDLMLTTRLIKRKEGTPRERAAESMVTGLTMTFTTLAALAAMVTLSYMGQIEVIFEISAVLLFGLFADIISTWLMNAPMLLWYVEGRAPQ